MVIADEKKTEVKEQKKKLLNALEVAEILIKKTVNHDEECFKALSYARKARFLCGVMYNTYFTHPIAEEAREYALDKIAELFDIILDYVVKAEAQVECIREEAAELVEATEKLKRTADTQSTLINAFENKV